MQPVLAGYIYYMSWIVINIVSVSVVTVMKVRYCWEEWSCTQLKQHIQTYTKLYITHSTLFVIIRIVSSCQWSPTAQEKGELCGGRCNIWIDCKSVVSRERGRVVSRERGRVVSRERGRVVSRERGRVVLGRDVECAGVYREGVCSEEVHSWRVYREVMYRG